MSVASRNGWIVATTSIGAVEALKDQLGVCRWDYGFRLIQQNAKKTVQSYYHTHLIPSNSTNSSSSSSSSDGYKMMKSLWMKKIERREKGLKKVMDLSCWGPTTVRF